MKKITITSKKAPQAIGPYSQALKVGNTLYCSGQIGLDPVTGALVTGGIKAEVSQVLQNLIEVLKAGKMKPSDVVQTTIYLTDMSVFALVNEHYGKIFFEKNLPARITVGVQALPKGAQVEIACVAVK